MAKAKKADFFSLNEFIKIVERKMPFDEFAEEVKQRAEAYVVEHELLEYQIDADHVTAEMLNFLDCYKVSLAEEPKLLKVCELLIEIAEYKSHKYQKDIHALEESVFRIMQLTFSACEYSQSERPSKRTEGKRELIQAAAISKRKESDKSYSWIAKWLVKQIEGDRSAFGYNEDESIPSAKTLQNDYLKGLT